MEEPVHVPILTREILELLAPGPHAVCIDGTIDGGGHSEALLRRTAPGGRVLGIDRDPGLLDRVRNRLAPEIAAGRLVLVNANFRDLGTVAARQGFAAADAILFDLGVSSYHFDRSGRGFSFRADEPLDMRFDPQDEERDTAAVWLNTCDARELTRIFREYGEERFAGRIASRIVATRPLATTHQLLRVIEGALPGNVRWQAARSAARVFQALRIAVNEELEAVAAVLPQAVDLLAPGGRLAVLSFHSLEDRIVKQFLAARRQEGTLRLLTRKAVRPGEEEVRDNSRAASARLRVAEKLPVESSLSATG